MRNRPPGTSTIPFVAVFTTYVPLATTSPVRVPSAHVHYILPGLALSGGGMDPRRTKHCRRVPTGAVARAPQRDSSSDSNAVTSAVIHRAPFAPSRAYERPLRRLRWLLLISGLGVRFPRGAPNVLARCKMTDHPGSSSMLCGPVRCGLLARLPRC